MVRKTLNKIIPLRELMLPLCLIVGGLIGISNAQGNYVVDSLRKALQEDLHDSIKARVYHELGLELVEESISESLRSFYKSKALSEMVNDTTGIVSNLIEIGDLYIKMGESHQALDFAKEALSISKGNCLNTAESHTQMSVTYFQIKEYELSLKHDKLSLDCYERLKDTLNIAYCIHNIGSYYYGVMEMDSAISYYKKSLQVLNKEDEDLYAYNYNRLGFAYTQQKKYNQSINCHLKALSFFEKRDRLYEMALEENYIASVYFMMRDFKNAFAHAYKSIEISKQCNSYFLFKMNYNLMYDLYNINKDYKNALKYSILEKAYSDSISDQNNESIIQSIKTKHEFNEQKRILQNAERSNIELTTQRAKLIVFSGISLFLLVICIVVLIQKRIKHKKNKELVVKLDHVNRSIRELLSIIGHDLRDSVGNLKNFTQLMHHELLDNKSIEKMVARFVPMVDSTHGLLDTLLIWTRHNDKDFVPKIEKLDVVSIVELLMSHLSHLANTKGVIIDQQIDDATFYADKNMILTVLRNLLSNAIKFSNPDSTVIIKSNVEELNVEFCIIDNGIGMTQSQVEKILNNKSFKRSEGTIGEKGSGLGLSLCNSFLAKHDALLSIESKVGKGSAFKFSVPRNYYR